MENSFNGCCHHSETNVVKWILKITVDLWEIVKPVIVLHFFMTNTTNDQLKALKQNVSQLRTGGWWNGRQADAHIASLMTLFSCSCSMWRTFFCTEKQLLNLRASIILFKYARYDDGEMRLNGKKARIASSMTICAPIFMFYVTDHFFHRKKTTAIF